MVKSQSAKTSERSIRISKAILLAFFMIYLIVYGIGISIFVQSYHEPIPLWVSYIPLLCFVGAGFFGITLIIFIRNATLHKTRQSKSKKKVKAGSIYKQALLLIIFIFSFIPLFATIIDNGENDQNFSVYNDQWNGCTDFKALLEEKGYDCYNIQSSLSTTERIENESILLVVMGTNQYYNPVYEIPYFMQFLEDGNSILICHDHGSTSNLLWEIFFANLVDPDIQKKVPLTIFPDGILRDHESYEKNPEFPVIKIFEDHPIAEGIDEVILSRSSAAVGGPFVEYSGWDVIGWSSQQSFIDKNDDKKFDEDDDNIDLTSIADAIGEDFPEDLLKFPLGIYSQPVFMAKETDEARIVVSADASLFNNELFNEDGYDNQQLALNMIKWLTRDEDKSEWMIVFDEAHIRPEKSRDLTSAGIFGLYIQYIVHLSTNPITAWIYPLIAVLTLKRYLPKKDKKKEEEKKAKEEEKKEEKARFRTSSFFAKKIEWYREKSKYDKALGLLYRRLERKLNSLLSGQQITTNRVINMVLAKEGRVPRFKIRRITQFMDRILQIKAGKKKIRNEREFEHLFFEMEWVVNNI